MILKLRKGEKKYPRPTGERVRVRGYRAFTLAEVLITLGIIGVVAAITIPNLVQNYQKTVTVKKLKKGYTLFGQVFNMAQNDFGEFNQWPEINTRTNLLDNNTKRIEFVDKYIYPYLPYVAKKLHKAPIMSLEGTQGSISGEYIWFYLKDGSCFAMSSRSWNQWVVIFYDINGDNGPNIVGRDIFVFDIGSVDSKFKFYDDKWAKQQVVTRDFLTNTNGDKNSCSKNKVNSNSGLSCGALIQFDGWKISDDYPW